MKTPFCKINLTKTQATLFTLVLTFSIFAITTLAPAIQNRNSQALPLTSTVDAAEEEEQIVTPPRAVAYTENASLGTFQARGYFTAPTQVKFVAIGSRNIGYYHWSFGDQYSEIGHNSASGSLPRAFHTYSKAGAYTVTVKGYTSYDNFRTGKVADTLQLTLKIRKQVVSGDGWIWPTDGKVISVVGMRTQPVTGEYRMHQGIDIQNKKGTTIVAARGGKVVATWDGCRATATHCGGGYGNYVVIHHANGLYSIYAHLSKVDARTGDYVSRGQKIGEMGSTGLTPDVHLHFGIGPSLWVNYNVLNPLKLLPRR